MNPEKPEQQQSRSPPPPPFQSRPALARPRQSAIRLRRFKSQVPTATDDANSTANSTASSRNANPQQVRSMLDVDGQGEGDRHQRQQQSINLRRLGPTTRAAQANNGGGGSEGEGEGKGGGSGNPQNVRSMLDVDDNNGAGTQARDFESSQEHPQQPVGNRHRLGRFGRKAIPIRHKTAGGNGHVQDQSQDQDQDQSEYDSNIVDMLDVVDPEVSTLSSITNVQNSLFVPSLGKWINRRPTYNLTRFPRVPGAFPSQSQENVYTGPSYAADGTQQDADILSQREPSESGTQTPLAEEPPAGRPSVERIPSTTTDRFYAVRPHNISLADWSDEDLRELDDHVRHMLHSRRSAFKRSMKAFGQYVRRPLGFFVTLYATLITLFGLAWVLFLIGWIYVGEQQLYATNVIDLVLVALFAIVGDGMIPFRTVDTYHMIYIARYYHLTWKLREKMAVPNLKDKNDLPSEPVVSGREEQLDLEAARGIHTKDEFSVLTPQQQAKLDHHQTKFAKSHTFYKPHETETHRAFPLRFLVAIVVLLDCHSCFQVALGLCTWCIDYRTRPEALTAVILSCSITVNATAGILISIGDRRTRKKDVVERMFRQELTEEAMRRVQARKEKKAKEEEEEKERQEKEQNRLRTIGEEDEKGGSGLNINLPKKANPLELLNKRHSSEYSRSKRKSVERSRKSIERVGKFDASAGEIAERHDNDGDDEAKGAAALRKE